MPVTRAEKQTLNPDSIGATGQTADYGRVGQGLSAYLGALPPADKKAKDGALGNGAAIASLSLFLIAGNEADTDVLLAEVAQQTRDVTSTSQKKQIVTDQQAQEAKQKAQEKKLQAAEKKMQEAKKKGHTMEILDGVKCAFAWIAAAAAIAVAGIMMATGAGVAISVLLIGAAMCAVALAVDSTVSVSTHKGGIAGNIALEAGASKSDAGKADMGFQISVSAIGGILSIGAGVAGIAAAGRAALSAGFSAVRAGGEAGAGVGQGAAAGGEAASGAEAAAAEATVQAGTTAGSAAEASPVETLKQVLEVMKSTFMDALRNSSDKITQTGKLARAAGGVSEGVTQAGATSTETAKGGVQADAEMLQADGKRLQAEGKKFQASIEMLDKVIDQALKVLMQEGDRYAATLDSLSEALKDKGDTASRVRFAG